MCKHCGILWVCEIRSDGYWNITNEWGDVVFDSNTIDKQFSVENPKPIPPSYYDSTGNRIKLGRIKTKTDVHNLFKFIESYKH